LFPDNPVACDSVARYIDAMKSAYVGVANGRRSPTFARS
jgi:2-O-sulfo trehalose long-chain-acyltransferase